MHPRSRSTSSEDGSAALEFIAVGVLLLVPLVYLIVALGSIQEQSLGVEAAARHLARALSLAPDAEAGSARGQRVLDAVAEEYGIDPGELDVDMSCAPVSSPCPAAGTTVTVVVSTRVRLPLVPAVLGLDRAASVPVEGIAVQKVSRVWGES
ncbi:TadE family protein [Microbacterium sp. NPDC089696]|jgi:Flp pilus assembly protein TadG|uniref:TadE family protein n=1 Tax=Microbacterium sp. NPDC089696 TaxID=3364199 RepID=UPI00381A724E